MENPIKVQEEVFLAILRACEQRPKTTEEVIAQWSEMYALGMRLAEGSMSLGVRFSRYQFPSIWTKVVKLLEPYEKAGLIDRRGEDRRKGVATLVLKDGVTDEELAAAVKPKREYKKKPPVVVEKVVVQKGDERIVERKPARKSAQESRAVVIDLANVTKRRDANGRTLLPVNRINWHAFRNILQMHHGEQVKLERLVLCVSAHYYADNRTALACAERAGFTVVTKYGEKEADPVVVCELMDVVHTALVRDYHDCIPTVVLVSGDADFSGVLHSLRKLVRWEGLALPLHVFSWEEALSRALDLNASKMTPIEEILRQIRLP